MEASAAPPISSSPRFAMPNALVYCWAPYMMNMQMNAISRVNTCTRAPGFFSMASFAAWISACASSMPPSPSALVARSSS